MSEGASRAQLIALREELAAGRRGREVLEEKLELLRRALARRIAQRDLGREAVSVALAHARRSLADAQTEIGAARIEASALAQGSWGSVDLSPATLAGIAVPRVAARFEPFRPVWGTGGTAASVDRAGAAFAAVLPPLLGLAEDEFAAGNLQRGLRKTARRLNALEKAIVPRLERQIRTISAALEEDERDESLRRERWIEQSGGARRLSGRRRMR